MTNDPVEKVDNATFLTGHVRSGTNLTMRLLDGTEGLAVPPGEGKLHVLRRGLDYFGLLNAGSINSVYDSSMVEVAQGVNTYADFLDMIRHVSFKGVRIGGRRNVEPVIRAVFEYHRLKTGRISSRWLEKNHNLEFFINRAFRSFTSPIFIITKRDPRAIWVSWKDYCLIHGLGLGPVQLRKNLAYMVVQEILEHCSGPRRFDTVNQILSYYCIPVECAQIFFGFASGETRLAEAESIINLIDLSCLPHSDTDVGAFCWNFKYLYARAFWARRHFPDAVYLLDYEDLLMRPQITISGVCQFIRLRPPEGETVPTEFGQKWISNSSFSNTKNHTDMKSLIRWREKVEVNERHIIEDLCADYLHSAA